MEKNIVKPLIFILLIGIMASCAAPQGQYNTQRGAAIGAGIGAILGQAIGQDTESTLLGTGVGTLIGAIAGNAVDQSHQAAIEAAKTEKRVVYYDDKGGAVEAIPGQIDQQTQCKKVTKRVWDNGKMVSETIEEICEGEKTTSTY